MIQFRYNPNLPKPITAEEIFDAIQYSFDGENWMNGFHFDLYWDEFKEFYLKESKKFDKDMKELLDE